jgi:hypothetical protein
MNAIYAVDDATAGTGAMRPATEHDRNEECGDEQN